MPATQGAAVVAAPARRLRLAEVDWPIKVTPDDVRYGLRGQPDACPISRALLRETGRRFWVRPDGADSLREAAAIGPRLRRWIIAFDRGEIQAGALLVRYDAELERLEVVP